MSYPDTYLPGFHYEDEVKKMQYNIFGSTKLKVSALSLGTGGFSYFYGKFSVEDCKKTVHEALKKGINYIDTAPWYGHGVSEEVLGKCLEGIPRKTYYLATKVGRYEADVKNMFDFSAQKTRQSIELSLKRLGVEYIDVLQVHDIEFAPSLDVVLNETLPVIQEYVEKGKVKFVGVTGYPVDVLVNCLKLSKVPIQMMLSYSRLCLVDQTLRQYLPYLTEEKNYGVVNACAIAMGLLCNSGPPPWHPANDHIKAICREAATYCQQNNMELARLALHYSLQQKGPHTNLVGMNTVQLLETNLDVLHNGLSNKELEALKHIQNEILSKLKETSWEKEYIDSLRKELYETEKH